MLLIRSPSLAQLLGIELYPKGEGEFIRVVIEAGGPKLRKEA